MPPHAPDESPVAGLPVRHRVIRPGSIVAGCVFAAAAALVAHASSLFAGIVWDDRVLLVDDERVRTLATLVTAWGESFFGPHARNEMYRPLVNASLALDWFLSGSEPGAVRAGWFHAVNWILHAANAALVYLLLAGCTKRRLGAPLLAAVLWAVHPLAVEPVTWIAGRCDLLAAACGLASAVLLLRSPGKPRLLAASVLLHGLGLFAKASIATMPVVVALALVAHHEVEPAKFLTPRFRGRFLWFVVPSALWIAARAAVLGTPFPVADGRLWKDVALLDGALGVGRAFFVQTLHVALPVRLSGDYAADPAWRPEGREALATSLAGLAMLAGSVVWGARRLRSRAAAFPLLAYAVLSVPVLQIVPIGAIFADRFLYVPSAFLLLAVAEGLERLYYRWGAVRGLTVTFVAALALPVLSHLRAAVWRDEPTFLRDVLVSYPSDAATGHRLALALSNTGDAADRAAALAMLRATLAERPGDPDAAGLLGALLLEDGDLAAAEPALRAAVDATAGRRRAGSLARHNLAVLLKRTGRRDEARRMAEQALALEPELAPAQRLLESLR